MFATSMGLLPCTTPVQSPESNGMAGGFISTFKRDYVHINRLETTVQVLAQLPTWFEDCNEIHPHRGLKMRSPREYRKSLSAASNAVEKYEPTGIVVYQASDPVGISILTLEQRNRRRRTRYDTDIFAVARRLRCYYRNVIISKIASSGIFIPGSGE
jgi:hypothetical protein